MPCVLRGGKRGDLMLPPRLPEEEALRGFFRNWRNGGGTSRGEKEKEKIFPPFLSF